MIQLHVLVCDVPSTFIQDDLVLFVGLLQRQAFFLALFVLLSDPVQLLGLCVFLFIDVCSQSIVRVPQLIGVLFALFDFTTLLFEFVQLLVK